MLQENITTIDAARSSYDDYYYIKSRFHSDSIIDCSDKCMTSLANMLRKIEHIDLRDLSIVPSYYEYQTSFGYIDLLAGKVGIVYETRFSYSNPITFAFMIAHEIRHYVQFKNDILKIGIHEYIFCNQTKIRYNPLIESWKGLDHYTSLPWEADANHFASTLVDIDNAGVIDLHPNDSFFVHVMTNRRNYYQF